MKKNDLLVTLFQEHNDALLVLLLATMTKGVATVGETLDKVRVHLVASVLICSYCFLTW